MQYIVMRYWKRKLIDASEPPSWCARKKKMDICLYESQAKTLKVIYTNWYLKKTFYKELWKEKMIVLSFKEEQGRDMWAF